MSLSSGSPVNIGTLPAVTGTVAVSNLAPGDVLCVAALVRTATATVDVSVIWVED